MKGKFSPALFKNPPMEYRGKPFWAWNGQLEKKELFQQIETMKEMGFGGFFMHSRTGLRTEYLSGEWFALIQDCAEQGVGLGMEPWIYDEDRWPSGTAGGLVTKNPAYRQKFISMHRCPREDFDLKHYGQEHLVSFAAKFSGQYLADYFEITDFFQIPSGYEALSFVVEEQNKQGMFNGYTYLDTMNRDATIAFLKSTHEKYKKNCGALFGKKIKGIFTDEPHRGSIFGGFSLQNKNKRAMIPYTGRLFETFLQKYGYSLKEKLPELYFFRQGENWSKTSYDYVEALQELFLSNFAKVCQDWCRENNLILTGHVLHEDSLSAQTAMCGSVQRYYEYMDYPGVDVLGENNRCYWVAKQLASVAKQLNKPFALSELYGCTGWQMRLEDHKHVGDWQAVIGVNLRCHHLAWYTMQGEAKRDFPGSISYQSAWHKEYRYVEDYFSRMNYLLSQGDPVTELLVINPIESVWGKIRMGCFQELDAVDGDIKKMEHQYTALFHTLTEAQIDFDYGDEDILARHAKVQDGKLWVGRMAYSMVVASGLETIRQTTLDLLGEFRRQGGLVIFHGKPSCLDGLKKPIDLSPYRDAATLEEIRALCTAHLSLQCFAGCKDIFASVRKCGQDYYAVFINTDRKRPKDTVLSFNREMNVETVDLRTGEILPCRFSKGGGWTRIPALFERGCEKAYRFTPQAVSLPLPEEGRWDEVHPGTAFCYQLSEPNALVLDLAHYAVDGQPKGFDEILKIDRKVREECGMDLRGGDMIQPWYTAKYNLKQKRKKRCNLELCFPFYVKDLPNQLFFACETPERFTISVNGHGLEKKCLGRYIDNAIFKFEIPTTYLKTGENELQLACAFTEEDGLEPCYLLGEFGVELQGHNKSIVKLPSKIDNRPLQQQFLPFYTGTLTTTLSLSPGKYQLQFPNLNCACATVSFGGDCQTVAFAPYQAEGTAGGGQIQIAYSFTRRNLFGPLHLTALRRNGYGPDAFLTEGEDFQMGYGLVEEGISIPTLKRKIE